MREIEGFVLTAKIVDPIRWEILFGPKTGNSDYSHEPFHVNGLVPFKRLDKINTSLEELRRRKSDLNFTRLGAARVRLEVAARKEEEIYSLKDESNFIIVAELDHGTVKLLGGKLDDIAGVAHAPVSDLLENGFRTIRTFDRALYALTEVERQGHVYAHLGTFHFKRIKIPRDLLS